MWGYNLYNEHHKTEKKGKHEYIRKNTTYIKLVKTDYTY
jgi:hypothetical protein